MESREKGVSSANDGVYRRKVLFAGNFIPRVFIRVLFILVAHQSLGALPNAGFSLPQNVQEITFNFESFKNLILLPVTINDTVNVNLILDTGCRNLLLFGKRFEKLFSIEPGHKIRFSGLGEGQPLIGKLSLNNKVSIHALLGEKIPIVIVPGKNLFSGFPKVHGVIGYDIFIKFEIEFNASNRLITFRPAALAEISPEFTKIALRVEDTRPLIQSQIFFSNPDGTHCDLMLDTGSALGLLLKSTGLKKFQEEHPNKILGKGFNGNVRGIERWTEKLILETFEIKALVAGVTWSVLPGYGSVGMDVMKDYTIVLNYCKAYAGFKKSQKRSKKQLV